MTDYDDRLSDYNSVPERIGDFRAKHPEGSLQPVDLTEPFRIVTLVDKMFVVYTAAAFRTPDDQRPGIGIAWEPFPGTTPYTRNSELQNAETSAWGRAIVAALAADAKKSVATREDVQNRTAMASADVVRALVESVKPKPFAPALKQRMAEHELSFTRPLSQQDFDTITDWVVELSETAGEGATSVAVQSAPSPVTQSSDGDPRRTSASEPTPAPSEDPSPAGRAGPPTAPLPAGESPGAGEAARGSADLSSASDTPEDLLALEETRALIARFNKLELEPKAAALGFKRSLGIGDWFAADPDALATLRAKVTELEGISA